jgi:hypothetical protein
MLYALEMKIALINAHIDLSATVFIPRTLLLLVQDYQITLLGDTSGWQTHKILPLTQEIIKESGEELKYSTDLIGTQFASMTFHGTMQKCFADLLVFHRGKSDSQMPRKRYSTQELI